MCQYSPLTNQKLELSKDTYGIKQLKVKYENVNVYLPDSITKHLTLTLFCISKQVEEKNERERDLKYEITFSKNVSHRCTKTNGTSNT